MSKPGCCGAISVKIDRIESGSISNWGSRHGPISHPAILAAKRFYEELPCSQICRVDGDESMPRSTENRGVLDS